MDAMQAVAKVNEERYLLRQRIEQGFQKVLDEIGPVPFYVTASVEEDEVTCVDDAAPRFVLRAIVGVSLPIRSFFDDVV